MTKDQNHGLPLRQVSQSLHLLVCRPARDTLGVFVRTVSFLIVGKFIYLSSHIVTFKQRHSETGRPVHDKLRPARMGDQGSIAEIVTYCSVSGNGHYSASTVELKRCGIEHHCHTAMDVDDCKIRSDGWFDWPLGPPTQNLFYGNSRVQAKYKIDIRTCICFKGKVIRHRAHATFTDRDTVCVRLCVLRYT